MSLCTRGLLCDRTSCDSCRKVQGTVSPPRNQRPWRETNKNKIGNCIRRHHHHHRNRCNIPRAINGQGYLRVTTKSLWWQHEQFPKVWTAEGLSTCSENGYQWTINSTMWNHLRVQWQGQPLDLLRHIHEEVHLQNTFEASGYRSPTWRTLRALHFCSKAKVLIGESMITAAPFFRRSGTTIKAILGTSARTESNSVGKLKSREPAGVRLSTLGTVS